MDVAAEMTVLDVDLVFDFTSSSVGWSCEVGCAVSGNTVATAVFNGMRSLCISISEKTHKL